MMRLRIVSWAFVIGAVGLALVACYPRQFDIGDATTAAELAPSLEALRDAAPEHHGRLVDGTFDSLSLLEQWDFVAELRELATERRETEAGAFRAEQKQWAAEFIDSLDRMPPEMAKEFLGQRREMILRKLKSESDLLRVENWTSRFTSAVSGEDALR